MEGAGHKGRWRGRRPLALVLVLLFLALSVMQVGPSAIGRNAWLAGVVPQPQQQQQATPEGGAPARGLPVPAALVPAVTATGPPHLDTSGIPAEEAARSLPAGANDSYVSLCIVVKDEHCDIREWVLHHASLGVGKVYLFDTQSEQPMRPVLDDLIASGLVHYTYLTNDTTEVQLEEPGPGRSINWQRPVYQLCLRRFGTRHTWMGFFDADEFVVPEGASASDPGSLPALLKRYEQHPGLALHWRFFSWGGHVLRPRGGVMASYTACSPGVSQMVKSIVQPRYVRTLQTVHTFAFLNKTFAVNTAGHRVSKPVVPRKHVSGSGAVLHHYISRSLADFEVKTRRRGGAGSIKTLANFLSYHKQGTGVCPEAVPLGQALAARYDLNRHVPKRCLDTERRRRQRMMMEETAELLAAEEERRQERRRRGRTRGGKGLRQRRSDL